MDGWTNIAWMAGGALGAVVLLGALATVLWRRERRRQAQEVERLRVAVADLTAKVTAAVPARSEVLEEREYVITHLGEPEDGPRRMVADQVVLSATLGEPLVKAAAVAHGLRRALSAENRNRITFEVRREIRRSRKDRRREMRAAWKAQRAQRAQQTEPEAPTSRADVA